MIKKIIGKTFYALVGNYLPSAHCRIRPVGKFSKWFRAMCGKLILQKCGKNVNIYPKAEFS